MKTKYFFTLLLSLGMILSCSDLEEDPKTFFQDAEFMQTEADAIGALTGAYSILRSTGYYGLDQYYVSDMLSDQTVTNFGDSSLDDFVFNSENGRIKSVWDALYIGVNRANYIIERTPGIQGKQELIDMVVAEGKFLRALHYFNLVKMWGDVPLRTTVLTSIADANQEKASREDIYAQIINDLNDAKSTLPDEPTDSQGARATSWAAKSLLAKVYLYAEQYEMATQEALDVIENGPFELFGSYEDIWLVTNENMTEHIYQVQTNEDNGSGLKTWFAPRGTDFPGNPRGWFHLGMSSEFFNSFEEGDTRKSLLDTTYINTSGEVVNTNQPFSLKYIAVGEPAVSDSQHNVNYPVLRFADVLLIHAEASARANDAPNAASYESINRVRERAFGNSNNNLSEGLELEDFINAVIAERNFEFFAEGDRYWDLTRTGRFLNAFPGFPVEQKHRYLPIPESEIISSGGVVSQNEGW